MTTHIRIPDISPVAQAMADGARCVFSFPFPIFTADDLEVRANSTLVTAGYTVVGEGSSTGGAVIFADAPANGVRLMDWFHPSLGLVAASSAFTLDGVQYPAGWLRHQQPDGFLPVRMIPRPDDRQYLVSEQIVTIVDGEAVVSWSAEPRDPAEIQAALDREVNSGLVARLEALDRRKVRPLGAIVAAQVAGDAPHPLDVAALAALEAEAAELRSQFRA